MWLFIAIFTTKLLFVVSSLIAVQKDDGLHHSDLLESFNLMYGLTVNEKYLNPEGYCSGNCDQFSIIHVQKKEVSNVTLGNSTSNCYGTIHHCWYEEQTEARREALTEIYVRIFLPFKTIYDSFTLSRSEYRKKYDKVRYTGNICGCLCERTFDPNFETLRGKLLDSICYDLVSVDNGYVATGVRFKRHNKTMHIELQQGKLVNGTIDPLTVDWKHSQNCHDSRRVISNFKGANYRLSEIILEDITFSETTVVTGVVFGKSLYGQYIDKNGDIDHNKPEKILKPTQCDRNNLTLLHGYWNRPPTMYVIGKNILQSESCKHRVFITGSSYKDNNMRHVIPYISVQEVITDPPEPVHGIGWYYHSHPKYEGYIGLRIFKKDKILHRDQQRYFSDVLAK